jgi:hypothetical protein
MLRAQAVDAKGPRKSDQLDSKIGSKNNRESSRDNGRVRDQGGGAAPCEEGLGGAMENRDNREC